MHEDVKEKIKAQVCKAARKMREENLVVPVSGERIDIPCEGRTVNVVYYRAKEARAPLFLAFHGGGFLFGGNAMNDGLWAFIRDYLDVNVASVEYRKSPDYQWREALEDAYEASCYLAERPEEFGFDPTRICTLGCSAGGNLAAALCLYVKERGGLSIYRQLLLYPFLDCDTDPAVKGNGSDDPIMHIFNELHCDPSEAKNPLASPVFASAEELKDLPEAVFVMADKDSLKYEGYQYARMLAEAGVWTHMMSCPGMEHAFIETAYDSPDSFGFQFMAPEIIKMYHDGTLARNARGAFDFIKKCL